MTRNRIKMAGNTHAEETRTAADGGEDRGGDGFALGAESGGTVEYEEGRRDGSVEDLFAVSKRYAALISFSLISAA